MESNSDEEFAFREQIQEAMVASAHQQPDELLMAIRFQEMLENQFSSKNNTTHLTEMVEENVIEEPAEEDVKVRWGELVEEYRKLSITMHELNFNELEELEFHDALNHDNNDGEEDEFSEATCSFESDQDGGFFSLYFKGVSDIRPPWDSKLGPGASAIGLILRRPQGGDVLLEVQKKLGYYVEESVAEHLALIEGLMAALKRGLRRVNAFTDSVIVYDQIARGRCLENDEVLMGVRLRVLEHVRKLDGFVLSLDIESVDTMNVMSMAREASGPRSFAALHKQYEEEEEEEEEEDNCGGGDNRVLYVGLGQKRQRRYCKPGFQAPAWGDVSKFSKFRPRTQALGIHSWKEREKGIGEWKFS